MKSYKDLTVWQNAMDLVVLLYKMTRGFPREEQYGLTSQIRRAVVSIPSNIAEGQCRSTRKEYAHFIRIAYGSGAELETLLEIGVRVEVLSKDDHEIACRDLSGVMKMLNKLIQSLSKE